jgi:hypothetical protein
MDLAAFTSTMIGAAVSILTSLAVFGFTSWTEGRKSKLRDKRSSAFAAFQGFQKLVHITNELSNTKRHIDEAFKYADENGLGDADPFAKIQPMVGAKAVIEPVRVEEMYFLVEAKLSHLMGEIDLIYRRALNTEAVVDQFNKMKLELGSFLEARMASFEPGEGTRAVFELVGNDAKLAHLRGAAMNNLIGQMLEHLEKDFPESKRLSETFLQVAQKHFGTDFPQVKLEWEF